MNISELQSCYQELKDSILEGYSSRPNEFSKSSVYLINLFENRTYLSDARNLIMDLKDNNISEAMINIVLKKAQKENIIPENWSQISISDDIETITVTIARFWDDLIPNLEGLFAKIDKTIDISTIISKYNTCQLPLYKNPTSSSLQINAQQNDFLESMSTENPEFTGDLLKQLTAYMNLEGIQLEDDAFGQEI